MVFKSVHKWLELARNERLIKGWGELRQGVWLRDASRKNVTVGAFSTSRGFFQQDSTCDSTIHHHHTTNNGWKPKMWATSVYSSASVKFLNIFLARHRSVAKRQQYANGYNPWAAAGDYQSKFPVKTSNQRRWQIFQTGNLEPASFGFLWDLQRYWMWLGCSTGNL